MEREKKENILRRKTLFRRKKEGNIWRRKIFSCGGKEQRRRKTEENIWRRKTFGQWRRRRTEKEKEENISDKESGDGQTEFPLVDSTPSAEEVE